MTKDDDLGRRDSAKRHSVRQPAIWVTLIFLFMSTSACDSSSSGNGDDGSAGMAASDMVSGGASIDDTGGTAGGSVDAGIGGDSGGRTSDDVGSAGELAAAGIQGGGDDLAGGITSSVAAGHSVNGGGDESGAGGASGGMMGLTEAMEDPNLFELLQYRPDMTRFVELLEQAGLDSQLAAPGAYTIFAPSNTALEAVPNFEAIRGDPEQLRKLLLYHMAGQRLVSFAVRARATVVTLQGGDLVVGVSDDLISVNGADMTEVDLQAQNGIVHVINGVLDPNDSPLPASVLEILRSEPSFSAFVGLIEQAQLEEEFSIVPDPELDDGGLTTVFAPTNDAFSRLSPSFLGGLTELDARNLILKHLAGGLYLSPDFISLRSVLSVAGIGLPVEVTPNGYRIGGAILGADLIDLRATNGAVHAMDSMININRDPTIMELLERSPLHSIFVDGLRQTGLDQDVGRVIFDSFITVFAPTDDAFTTFAGTIDGDGTVDALFTNPQFFREILLNHLVDRELTWSDLQARDILSSQSGRILSIDAQDDQPLKVGGAALAPVVQGCDISTEERSDDCGYAHNGRVYYASEVIAPPEYEAGSNCAQPEALDMRNDSMTFERYASTRNLTGTAVYSFVYSGMGDPTGEDFFCFSTVGSAHDTRLTVRSDCDNPGNDDVFNDDVIPGVLETSQLTAELNAGDTYYVIVERGSEPGGDFALNIKKGICQFPLTITALLHEIGGFDSTIIALDNADRYDALDSESGGNYTVFAPNEEAWNRLDMREEGASDALLFDDFRIRLTMDYHILESQHSATGLLEHQQWTTLNGQAVSLEQQWDDIFVDQSKLVQRDLRASNGMVHVIERILVPSVPCENDLVCAEGEVCREGFCAVAPPPDNLYRELEVAGEFTRFLGLLRPDLNPRCPPGTEPVAVGNVTLEDALRHDGPFTLFALTDAVLELYEAADPVAYGQLVCNTQKLESLLTYHLLDGDYDAHSLYGYDRLMTKRGIVLSIDGGRHGIHLGDEVDPPISVVEEDRVADNGRYHVIDGVIDVPRSAAVGTCSTPTPIQELGRIIGRTDPSSSSQLDPYIPNPEVGEVAPPGSALCGQDLRRLCLRGVASPESVFVYRPENDGTMCVYTENAEYDTMVYVRKDSCSEPTAELACNNDSSFVGGSLSALEIDVEAGSNYYVVVDGCSVYNRGSGEAGHFLLTVDEGPCQRRISIMDRLQARNQEFRTLIHALRVTGLDDWLDREEPYTLFAPTERAFETLSAESPGFIEELTADPERLLNLLKYHIVEGAHSQTELVDMNLVATLDDQQHFLEVLGRGNIAFVNGANLIETLPQADNGFVHSFDKVFLAPDSCSAGPDCSAQQLCLKEDENVAQGQCMPLPPLETVYDRLASMGQFTEFLSYTEQVFVPKGNRQVTLRWVLENESPLTVFAPDDEAFASFSRSDGPGYAAMLASNSVLSGIMLYHIVTGEYPSGDLPNFIELMTDQGQPLVIEPYPDGAIKIGGKNLKAVDQLAFNGTIHVLDGVMSPPDEPDACSAPQLITDFGEYEGDTTEAGSRYSASCGAANSAEAVFRYTPDEDERVCFRVTQASFDSVLYIRDGSCREISAQANCPDEQSYTCCNDDQRDPDNPNNVLSELSALTLNAEAGQTYHIFVDGYASDNVGDFTLEYRIGGCGELSPQDNIFSQLDDERFSRLRTGLQRSNMDRILRCDTSRQECDNYTLIAPTNDAFEVLNAAIEAAYELDDDLPRDLDALMRQSATWEPMMHYHLMLGTMTSEGLANETQLNSLEGRPWMVEVRNGVIYVSGIPLVEQDILATNGVIHVVDTILDLPEPCVQDADCRELVGDGYICGAAAHCIVEPPIGTCGQPISLLDKVALGEMYCGTSTESPLEGQAFPSECAFYADYIPSQNWQDGVGPQCGVGLGSEHVFRFRPDPVPCSVEDADEDGQPDQPCPGDVVCDELSGFCESAPYCVSTGGSTFDTVLYAREGECGNVTRQVKCNDNWEAVAGPNDASAMNLDARAGESYYLFVEGYHSSGRGLYSLTVSEGNCVPRQQ